MLNNLRCSRGFSVIELLVGFALFGALVVAAAEGMRLYIATNKHVKVQEQVLDVRANLRNRLNCEYTLAPILSGNQCDGSQYVNLKDGNNIDIVLANGSAKIGDYKIRSRCRNLGGFYGITAEYLRTNSAGTTAMDPMLVNKTPDWKPLSAVPIACLTNAACINLPANAIPDTPPSGNYASLKRMTYYHGNIAVNPSIGNSASGPLRDTQFSISDSMLKQWIEADGVKYIEWLGFAHEFGSGFDKVRMDFSSKGGSLSAVSAANDIYSAYGFVSVENASMINGKPFGTVKMKAFNAYTGGLRFVAGNGKDITNFAVPASTLVAEDRLLVNVSLSGMIIGIQLFSDKYDSIQWRSIRANLWAEKKPPKPPPCSQ